MCLVRWCEPVAPHGWWATLAQVHLLGPVTLTVADLDRCAAFYEQVLGLYLLSREDPHVALGTSSGDVLVCLAGDSSAPRPQAGASGLYHLALLLPDRVELARAARRIADARWNLTGAADHLVSEALYLHDAEGNGIEIYRDQPRGDWRYGPGGELEMATLPLDLDAVMAELPAGEIPPTVEDRARIGHVHLHVQDLAAAGRFYTEELGFEVTVSSYPGALFLSQGGYHHHIGLNTWSGRAGAPPAGALGLRSFEINQAGRDAELADPSGNSVLLHAK